MPAKGNYASYLLRIWRMRDDAQPTWVASIQSPATGEQRCFSSVGALLAFLQAEFGESERPGHASPEATAEHAP